MSLEPGHRLGPYEIVAPIGAGGMGEVYRARDARLNRDVAIKVLPEDLQADPDVRARFEREARAVSALNDPNICQVYDVGHEAGVDYLVLELLDGESLAARLEKGPLTSAEVLRIGGQIADGLDRAHRAGIIHRDLKPGNVMLTRQGAKLLDFGLARPSIPAQRGGTPLPGMPSSPTMSRPLTAAGSIVGTFQYMAPEQLEGAEADARSDVWALGATLYEAATGKRAFDGKSQASLIASILREDPRPIAELVPLSPPGLDRLLRGCLAKDPEERVQTAHDVKLQLQWIAEGGSQAGVPAPVAAARRQRERMAWITAGVLGAIAAVLAARAVLQPRPVHETVRFLVEAPDGVTSMGWPKISPDGRLLSFQARDSSGIAAIWVRPLNTTVAYALQGTQSSGRAFWSPDSKELGYFADGKLYRIPAGGGTAQLVGEAKGASDGAWGAGTVVFDGVTGDSLRQVPAVGGPIAPATSFDRKMGESQHAWPSFLPDGKHFLFQAFRVGNARMNLIRMGTLGSLQSVLVDSAESRAEFLAPDHIVFERDGALIARRVSTSTWKPVGNPIVIGEHAGTTGNTEAFSVSSTGIVAYQSLGASEQSVVSSYDRAGHRLATLSDTGPIRDIAISPDGTRLALAIADEHSQKRDIWVRDLARKTQTRLTFDPADDFWPVWSPAGDSVAFTSDRLGEFRIFVKPASGLAPERLVGAQGGGSAGPVQWTGSGVMTAQAITPGGTWQSYWFRTSEPTKSYPVAPSTSFNIQTPRVSPDGKFLLYSSDESGVNEIFAQQFPVATGRWQISDKGGLRPYWSKDGTEILYRARSGFLTSVPTSVTPDGSLNAGTPTPMFNISQTVLSNTFKWMPSPDGQTIYVSEPAGSVLGKVTPIIVVLDANAELADKK